MEQNEKSTISKLEELDYLYSKIMDEIRTQRKTAIFNFDFYMTKYDARMDEEERDRVSRKITEALNQEAAVAKIEEAVWNIFCTRKKELCGIENKER